MYVTSRRQLVDELGQRRARREEIRERVDRFITARYGIRQFSALVEKHHAPIVTGPSPATLLGRDIATVTLEEVYCFLGSLALDLAPWESTYAGASSNSFLSLNPGKAARLKIPWVEWSKRGKMILEYVRLVEKPLQKHDWVPYDLISTCNGRSLLEYHADLRAQVFGESYPTVELSHFLLDCLTQATHRPDYVYVLDGRNKEIKQSEVNGHASLRLRPPAEWYYVAYLCRFLDGSMVFLENFTRDGDIGTTFERAMREIHESVGWWPVVVQIPYFRYSDLPQRHDADYYYNRHLLSGLIGSEALIEVIRQCDDLLEMFHKIARWAIEVGKPL